MSTLFELVAKGGVIMLPLAGLSIATIACALDRGWYWYNLYRTEDRIAHRILEAARYSLVDARKLAKDNNNEPIGRFLFAALKLNEPTPETFRLALEVAVDDEIVRMKQGDKLLESVVGIAPLLGLLGTVTGLIATFNNLDIGGGNTDTGKAAAGISEALITTAGGMLVAIIALSFFRIFISLQAKQTDFLMKIGGELELIYRELWYEPAIAEQAKMQQAQLERSLSNQILEDFAAQSKSGSNPSTDIALSH